MSHSDRPQEPALPARKTKHLRPIDSRPIHPSPSRASPHPDHQPANVRLALRHRKSKDAIPPNIYAVQTHQKRARSKPQFFSTLSNPPKHKLLCLPGPSGNNATLLPP